MHHVFTGHSGSKPEIRDRKLTGKPPNTWKPRNTLLNNSWVKSKARGKSKHFYKKMKHNILKLIQHN